MSKSKITSDLEIQPEIFTHSHTVPEKGTQYLFQIKSLDNKAVLDFCHDPMAYPNELAIYNHNKFNKDKVSVDTLPETANHWLFRIYNTSVKDVSRTKKLIAEQLVPELITTMFDKNVFDFVTPPQKIHFYPAENNDTHLMWMMNAVQASGIPVEMLKIQTGGKKLIDGFAFDLR